MSSQSDAHDEDPDTESELSRSYISIASKDEYEDASRLSEVMDSTEALRDMRCYVAFVDREIMPRYNLLEGNEPQRVSLDDLWSLFHVGELVYAPTMGNNTDGYFQELWRVYYVLSPEPQSDKSSTGSNHGFGRAQDELLANARSTFEVYCYHIDHDGSSYGAVRRIFNIESFPGEREINSLEVYPFRLAENRDQVIQTLQEQGMKFQRTFEQQHQSYNNWSLAAQMKLSIYEQMPVDRGRRRLYEPSEISREDNYSSDNKVASEFIESHVIVDLEEAFKANPDWRPHFHRPPMSKPETTEPMFDDE